MQSIEVIRERALQQLVWDQKICRQFVELVPSDQVTTLRDGGDGWNVLEVVCHLRDYEQLVIERVNLALSEDNPTLPGMQPDQLAADRKYNEQDLQVVLNEWQTLRTEHLAIHHGLAPESWEVTAKHPKRGALTLVDQLMITIWHDTLHMEQMTKILKGT